MTKLLIEELKSSTLVQVDTVRGGERLRLNSVRLWLVGFNTPSLTGSLQLNLVKNSTTFKTITQSIASIKAQIDLSLATNHPHWHGWVKFDLQTPSAIEEGTEWSMELSGISGYSFINNSYIGWVKPHEDLPNDIDGLPASVLLNPFGYQLWNWTKRVR